MKKHLFIIIIALLPIFCHGQGVVQYGDGKYYSCGDRIPILGCPGSYDIEHFTSPYVLYEKAIQTVCYYSATEVNIHGVAVTTSDLLGRNGVVYIGQYHDRTFTILDSVTTLRTVCRYDYLFDSAYHFLYDESGNLVGHDIIYNVHDTVPSYEFYFEMPVTVIDTFMVGFRALEIFDDSSMLRQAMVCGNNSHRTNECWLGPCANLSYPYSSTAIDYPFEIVFGSLYGGIFPVMIADTSTTGIDTTGTGGGDTVGISAVTGQVAIDIAPNPTDNVTTVSSAVPLRMVEAYDVAGRLLLRQPATGRTAKIDMNGYRPGCYILKIHTTSGTAHRKLLRR